MVMMCHCPLAGALCEPLARQYLLVYASKLPEPAGNSGGHTQKELLMSLFSQISPYFWLLFSLAVAIAVFRELRREDEQE